MDMMNMIPPDLKAMLELLPPERQARIKSFVQAMAIAKQEREAQQAHDDKEPMQFTKGHDQVISAAANVIIKHEAKLEELLRAIKQLEGMLVQVLKADIERIKRRPDIFKIEMPMDKSN